MSDNEKEKSIIKIKSQIKKLESLQWMTSGEASALEILENKLKKLEK